MKKKRLILVGRGGSGKDYLAKILKDAGFTYSVSHTSRPMRLGELDGVDYYFIDKQKAIEMSKNLEFYEFVEFNDWFYGTSLREFERANLFIMTPSGIGKLRPEHRKESLILFLDIEEDVLMKRLSERGDVDSSIRRFEADRSDFNGFSDFDLRVTNPNFTLNEILENINPASFGISQIKK